MATSATTSILSSLMPAAFDFFPPELFIVIGAWFFFSVFAFVFGVSRLHAIGLAGITTAFLVSRVQSAWLIGALVEGGEQHWTIALAAPAAMFVVFYFVYTRLCDSGVADDGDMVSSALSALAVTMLVFALWSGTFVSLWPFPEALAFLFAPMYFLWWVVGALVVLSIMHQRRL